MFRMKIIHRLILVFVVFSVMVMVPFSLMTVTQVEKIVKQMRVAEPSPGGGEVDFHDEFVSKLESQLVPYGFFVLILSFIFSIFFFRKLLISLKQLKKGSLALRDGDLDMELDVTSDDELGDVIRSFNEMTASLRGKTRELQRKDLYINAMLDPLWVIGEDDRIVDVNPAFTRLCGYDRAEAVGAVLYDFFDGENKTIVTRQIREKRDRGLASIYEVNIRAKDGTQIPVLISGSPIYSGGRLVGDIGILKDFREQRRLLEELERSKEYVETIIDSVEEELVVIGRDYRITRANKVASQNASGPVVGEYCYKVFHEGDHPCWTGGEECPAEAVFRTGKNYVTTHSHRRSGKEKRFHEIVASPVKDASGNVVSVIELIRDVTERIRHEEEILRKNRELVALNSVAGLLSRSLRPDEIFTNVLDKMIDMLRMDGGSMFFFDETKKDLICKYHRGTSDEFVKLMGRMKSGEDIPGKVAVNGQLVATTDLSKDQMIERSIIKHSGIKGYCCVPIRGKERIIGVYCLFGFKAHEFTAEEQGILVSIGEMTGIALENIKLYEGMRALYEYQRKRREEEHSQLLSLSSRLGSALELKDILGRVLDLIKAFFTADFVWLLVCGPDGDLVVKSVSGSGWGGSEVIYPGGVSSFEGYALEMKTPSVIADLRQESKFFIYPRIREMSYHSAVAVPMLIGEKTVGVCSLYFQASWDFREEELHFLRIIGNILAVAIERSDYYISAISEKELSDTILQSVADGIITVNTEGQIIAVNRSFQRMTGVPPSEAKGMPTCDVLRYSAENDEFRWALGECLEQALGGSRTTREAVLTTVYGNKIPVLIGSSPVFDAGGQVRGVVNLLRDISREKEIDRMKTEIIRSVSHEFRTPLSAIIGMTEMIRDGDVAEPRMKQYLDTILSEGIRLSKMVSDLLNIARIESGKEGMRFETVDMEALLQEVLRSLSTHIEKKRAVIMYDIGGVKSFAGDEEKIRQLLINLLDNAITFSDDGCKVEIKVRRSGETMEIAISDNGWGIPVEDVPHLTERFYRGKNAMKVKGTGLGLSLCSEIVNMYEGSMEIQSREGSGTEVIVTLPWRGRK